MSVESADIESAYDFCVNCFNKKNELGLAPSVKKKWVFKVGSKIVGNTLNSPVHKIGHSSVYLFNFYETHTACELQGFLRAYLICVNSE